MRISQVSTILFASTEKIQPKQTGKIEGGKAVFHHKTAGQALDTIKDLLEMGLVPSSVEGLTVHVNPIKYYA